MGLSIASIGLYGVIGFSVSPPTNQVGMRIGLGVRRVQVLAMMSKYGILLTAVGSGIGLGIVLDLSRITALLLYGARPADSPTFLAVRFFYCQLHCWRVRYLRNARRRSTLTAL